MVRCASNQVSEDYQEPVKDSKCTCKRQRCVPKPGNYALTKEGAKQACVAKGWAVKWESSSSLICTKGGVGAGNNCNKCDTWRLMVWKNGGTDQSSSGQTYHTKAGHSYAGHSPCRSGWNLPDCNDNWSHQKVEPQKPVLTKEGAEKACKAIGWNVKWRSDSSLVCTKGGVSAGNDCNKCDTWRLMVWKDGGRDQAHGGKTYSTKAGHSYGGHSPCKVGWNLPNCNWKWA